MPQVRLQRWLPPRRILVLAAQGSVLIAILVGAAVYAAANKTVTVTVEGHSTKVHTYNSSVRSVLDKADVTVGPHDSVDPPLGQKVHDHGTVTVHRGRLLTLQLGTAISQRWVTAGTVQGALQQLGLAVPDVYVSAAPTEVIGLQGATLTVRLPQEIRILADGADREVISTASTVSDLLAQNNIKLGRRDALSVSAAAYPTGGMTVSITRVSARQERASEVLEHIVQRIPDDTLYVGDTRTVRSGQDGVMTLVYDATYTNGHLSKKVLAAQTMTVAMQPTVIAYGTRPQPAPVIEAATVSSLDGLNWAALASCESGGNPRSVSGGGIYRGLYQFSMSTWRGVGGSGDPIDASPSEQTYRAQLLYRSSGRAAWPVCGRFL